MNHPQLIVQAITTQLFLVIGIIKHAVRLLIWISVFFAMFIFFGITKQSDLLNWFENLFKIAE